MLVYQGAGSARGLCTNLRRLNRTPKQKHGYSEFPTNVTPSNLKMTSWMREAPTGPSSEDYLLGKEVDKNFEQQGTMGQINAVEYGKKRIIRLKR